ncbi:MAG: hybrid sensor histidine kinase/response regulator [Cyanobacteria bacterium P01_F01_bin.86]
MSQPSILVVDDEVGNFDVIETMLSHKNYQLHYVDSGQEAINSLDLFQPDLILLDATMPGMDGLEVCRQIKAMPQRQSIPIVMVTALSEKKDLARCLNAGADDFISKPVNRLELGARVKSMLRIKQQHDNLQALLRFREDIVHMLVHDLRNRLTEVLLGLEFLKSEHIDEGELNQIHSSAQTLEILVDDLLKVALLESNKIRLTCTEADVSSLIKSVTLNFKAIAAQKKQTLICQVPEYPVRKAALDITMMHRVLDNLLSNAIKFSPHSSEILTTLMLTESNKLKIQVIDSGPGVPYNFKEKIFGKYEIGPPVPNVSQTGLGLAFSKMIVEAHGGKICVRNNQPQGAIFEITLPL